MRKQYKNKITGFKYGKFCRMKDTPEEKPAETQGQKAGQHQKDAQANHCQGDILQSCAGDKGNGRDLLNFRDKKKRTCPEQKAKDIKR